MSRIEGKFRELKKQGRKALVTFITAGDPDLATTEKMILRLEETGADIIELGIPFSDPMADGPTIQLSSERALASGATLTKILSTVKNVREKTQVPILLMGYYNPILQYGVERFAGDAREAGVDAILLVDLPPEEASEISGVLRKQGVDLIFLLTPTSDAARIAKVVRLARGFIYYVSVTGVTGARTNVSSSVPDAVARIKQATGLPVAVGFGISTPAQAADVARYADGVVVGSALVAHFARLEGDGLVSAVGDYVADLSAAISGVS